MLSSDEDELNDKDAEYLERLQSKIKSKSTIAPCTINSVTIEVNIVLIGGTLNIFVCSSIDDSA